MRSVSLVTNSASKFPLLTLLALINRLTMPDRARVRIKEMATLHLITEPWCSGRVGKHYGNRGESSRAMAPGRAQILAGI